MKLDAIQLIELDSLRVTVSLEGRTPLATEFKPALASFRPSAWLGVSMALGFAAGGDLAGLQGSAASATGLSSRSNVASIVDCWSYFLHFALHSSHLSLAACPGQF